MKFRNLIVVSVLALFVGFSACRDDFDFDISSKPLVFSTDTLNLDTIFNHTKSQTYKITIHNTEKEDIRVPRVYLTNGANSLFNLNVDGQAGFEFEDVAIRSRDSIFIFVEVAAGDAPANPFYEDEINFETSSGNQQLKLLTYIEKAKFYNVDEELIFPLGDQNWDNEYSRVIFGRVTADNLVIGPGTRVYFHEKAALIVNQSLQVQGNLNNKVVFRTDRMDERSDTLPKSWDKIHLRNSQNSSIDYAVIRGGTTGLEVENSKLNISNTKILNNEKMGLYTRGNSSEVTGKNLVINNSDIASLVIEGGTHEFTQSTFGNYFYLGTGTGNSYSLWLADIYNLFQANFYNCIFYGRSINAVQIDDGVSNYIFENNVIRNDLGDFTFSSSNITDEDPDFADPGFGKNDLRLTEKDDSAIPGHGNTTYIIGDPVLEKDILGVPRLNSPTPGAYQEFYVPID